MFNSLRILNTLIALLSVLAFTSSAWAEWRNDRTLSNQHPSWIYEPSAQGGTVDNGKWALMVVLHGCAQTAEQLKDHGGLKDAAERHGFVLALPNVGKNAFGETDDWAYGCWDYDQAFDLHGHIKEIKQLTTNLIARYQGKIHPAHIYVVGLSSGGALSQALGCSAPHIFAGIGSIAGPSVGSWQLDATADRSALGSWKVDQAVGKCLELAGNNAPKFKTQIANVGSGTMDKNGSHQGHIPCSTAMRKQAPVACSFPGQYKVVSVGWSDISAEMYRRVYGAGPLRDVPQLTDGLEFEKVAEKAEQPPSRQTAKLIRLGQVSISDVGHAWPAGSGKPGDGGDWIAAKSLNYPEYIMNWFVHNNRRVMANTENAHK